MFLFYMGLAGFDEGFRYDKLDLAGGVACLPVAWVVSWVLSRCFPPCIVSKDGIQGDSCWGFRRFIPWQEIKEARGFRFFHLRWVRLYSARDQKVTWIVLFQAHSEDFVREIQTLAPSDSPILRFVAKPPSPES
jgi:hypothetical protein